MKRQTVPKVVLVVLLLLFCAALCPVLMAKEESALALMMSLYVTPGHLLAACSPKPVHQSEPDRVHGVIKLRSCRSHGGARITTLDRSQGIDRLGRPYHHWRSLERAGSDQAIY